MPPILLIAMLNNDYRGLCHSQSKNWKKIFEEELCELTGALIVYRILKASATDVVIGSPFNQQLYS